MCTFWTSCSHVCEPNISWNVLENEFCESWKTLEFGLCKTRKVLKNSILLSVQNQWNSLSKTIIDDDSVTEFKSTLKTFVFIQAFALSSSHQHILCSSPLKLALYKSVALCQYDGAYKWPGVVTGYRTRNPAKASGG